MKLVEILARELEKWPNDAEAEQDYDKEVRFLKAGSSRYDFFASELADRDDDIAASDGIPYAGRVTREEWEAAKAKLAKPVAGMRVGQEITLMTADVGVGKSTTCTLCLFDAAPEGTTHYSLCRFHTFKWHKLENGMWYYHADCDGWCRYGDQDKAGNDLADAIERYPTEGVMEEDMEVAPEYYEENPVLMRERILFIRSNREALMQEEAELIQKLQDMGFALVEGTSVEVEPELDMPDPADWEVGDIIECVEGTCNLSEGDEYTVLGNWTDAFSNGTRFIGVRNNMYEVEDYFASRFKFIKKGESN